MAIVDQMLRIVEQVARLHLVPVLWRPHRLQSHHRRLQSRHRHLPHLLLQLCQSVPIPCVEALPVLHV